MRRWQAAALAACVLASVATVAVATVAGGTAAPVPQGEPQPGEVLRDGDFGVARRGFGLQRRVEMYQWSAGDDGFHRVWNAAPIDSSNFPRNRRNPPEVPLESRRWWSSGAVLDKRPIDVEVLKRLGDWQQFRPSFSRLPGNLAATFQPDGDGLSSSTNTLDPQIGDLRVTWQELELPPLAGKVELRDGRWELAPREPAAPERPGAGAQAVGPTDAVDSSGEGAAAWPWWLALAGLALITAAVLLFRRRL